MIAKALEEVSDWDALAGWLNINSDIIRTNCGPFLGLGQCYRRELVKTYCDRLPLGNSYQAADDIANVLEFNMEEKRQAQALRDLHFSSELYVCSYMYTSFYVLQLGIN